MIRQKVSRSFPAAPLRSDTKSSSRGTATLTFARVGWGGLLIVVAPRLLRAFGLPSDRRAMVVVRVLGLRHLVQAGVGTEGRSSIRVGAGLDFIHGSSMLLLAVFNAPRRRAALLDATVSFGFATGGLAVATKAPRPINRTETNVSVEGSSR